MPPAQFKGKSIVVQTHRGQDGRMQVAKMDRAFDSHEAADIGGAEAEAGLHAAARHPEGKPAEAKLRN